MHLRKASKCVSDNNEQNNRWERDSLMLFAVTKNISKNFIIHTTLHIVYWFHMSISYVCEIYCSKSNSYLSDVWIKTKTKN